MAGGHGQDLAPESEPEPRLKRMRTSATITTTTTSSAPGTRDAVCVEVSVDQQDKRAPYATLDRLRVLLDEARPLPESRTPNYAGLFTFDSLDDETLGDVQYLGCTLLKPIGPFPAGASVAEIAVRPVAGVIDLFCYSKNADVPGRAYRVPFTILV